MRTPGGFHVDAPAEGERGTPTGRRGLRSSSGRGVALGIVGSPVGRSPGCPADAGRGREGTGASADVPIGRIRFTGEPCIPRPLSRRRVGVCHRLRPLADEGVGSGALCRVTDADVPIGRIRFTGEPCTLGRVADGELVFATDSGCWPTKVLAVEPSGPLVCRVTDASV